FMQRGVSACFWPGRMEEVRCEVYVDGAHNVDGVRAFLESVAADGYRGRRHLLFGVVRDKDYSAMLHRIITSGLFDRLGIVQLNNARAVAMESLQQVMEVYPEVKAEYYASVQEALQDMLQEQMSRDMQETVVRIYIAGSLYLAGEVKAILQSRI
ncbi:MAG: hypothetical protein K2O34_07115, partial [Acetatifactor sp.]|nr:hypothetical protein [Acetatifactor sp.]